MLRYSTTISKSSVVSAAGCACAIVQGLDSTYAELDILVIFKSRLSPKKSELALGAFMKVVVLFLGFKMDISFVSFGFRMREFWLDLCSIFKLKFQQ